MKIKLTLTIVAIGFWFCSSPPPVKEEAVIEKKALTEEEKQERYNEIVNELNTYGDQRDNLFKEIKDLFPDFDYGIYSAIRSDCFASDAEYDSNCISLKLTDLEKKHPKSFLISYTKGKALHAEKKYKKAISQFNKAALLNPEFSRIYQWRSECKNFLSDLDGAIADMQEYLKRSPEDGMNWFNIGAFKQQKEQKAKRDEREYCLDFKKASDLGFTHQNQDTVIRNHCGDFSMPMYSLKWFMAIPSICSKPQPAAVVTHMIDNGCKLTANAENAPGLIHLDCKENPIIAQTGESTVVFVTSQEKCRTILKVMKDIDKKSK